MRSGDLAEVPARLSAAPGLSRRGLLAAGAVAVFAATSCGQEGTPRMASDDPSYRRGRLTFRPAPTSRAGARERRRTGLLRIGSPGRGRDALAWVPADGGDRLRLVVVLHGAGGDAFRALELWRPEAEEHGLLLLAPTSAAATWDVITGGYGPDVRRLDRLLVELAGTYPLGGLSISGFSDGASYALSLALANGNVFDSCVAFSPGFTAALEHVGRPRFFISHGTGDRVLPIDRCSRRIVPRLKEAGYDVEYQEFPGGHEVPRELRSRAAAWVTA